MIFSVEELVSKKFSKSFRGYNKKEVIEFLHSVIKDYEETEKEKESYKDNISTLEQSVHFYKTMEDSIRNTLHLSQVTSSDTIKVASEKAETVLSKAQNEAAALLSEAKAQADRIMLEADDSVRKKLYDAENEVDRIVYQTNSEAQSAKEKLTVDLFEFKEKANKEINELNIKIENLRSYLRMYITKADSLITAQSQILRQFDEDSENREA